MYKKILTFTIAILAVLVILPGSAQAQNQKASLEFKHKSFNEDQIVADIYIDTGSYNVNTVTADFTYPSKVLEVTNIRTDNSVFENFIEKDYSTPGTVYISCFSLDGFEGEGTIASITFKTLTPGKAALEFTDDAVVLDAETSTDVMGNAEDGLYTVTGELDVLPQTGTTENVLLGLLILILLVMIILFAIAGFTIWGGIYFSLGKWKVGGKYEVGIGSAKKKSKTKKKSRKSTKKKSKKSKKK